MVSYASAAALSVSAATLTSVTVGNPCTGTATTGNPVGGSTAITVNVALPPECVVTSRTVQVTVVDSGGAHSSAAVVMSGSTQAFTVSPAYTASATVTPSVTVDGWNLPTTWAFTPPATGCVALNSSGDPAPGGSCTITGLSLATPWGNGGVGHRQTNGHVLVSSSSPYISFTVDLRSGLPANWVWSTSGTVQVAHYTPTAGYGCNSLPILSGRTNADWGKMDFYVVLFENRAEATDPLNCS